MLTKNLEKLFERDRPLNLFISRADPGYDLIVAEAKSLVRKSLKSGKIRLRYIENADHTFTTLGPRSDLIAQLRAQLK